MKIGTNVTGTALLICGLMVAPALMASPQERTDARQASTEMEESDSAQPASDTWITTKVKADLLASPGVSGTSINVETVNGVVSLSGKVDSKTHADEAVAIAKKVKGVKSVNASALTVAKASGG